MGHLLRMSYLIMSIFALFATNCFADDGLVQFSSGEHVDIGNDVVIFMPVKVGDTYQYEYIAGGDADFRAFTDQNLTEPLSYGKILAAPDMFADAHAAISDGPTFADRRNLFEQSFNVFLNTDVATLDKVYSVMDQEVSMIGYALQNNIPPSDLYAKFENYFVVRYFLAVPSSAELFINGWDHFAQNAWLSYQAGHAEAIDMADQARRAIDMAERQKLLALAFAKEAYAGHFLADGFSSGHMRVPDEQLVNLLSKQMAGKASASMLGFLMHNEDNVHGLAVSNNSGDTWYAYGDTYYYDEKNTANRNMISKTMQASANEVTEAYRIGVITPVDKYAANILVVNLDRLQDYISYVDSTEKTIPMFVADTTSSDVLRRLDLNMLHPDSLPITPASMLQHGGKDGWHRMPSLLYLLFAYNPTLQAQINSDIDKYVTKNGELNDNGLKLFSDSLNVFEKAVFCADSTTSSKFRGYLRCDKLTNSHL